MDLVTEAELREVEGRIRAINPSARLHKTTKCQVPISAVLGQGAFDLERILEIEPAFLEVEDEHDHDHHDHGHGHDHGHHHHHDHGHDHKGLKHYHDEEMQSVAVRVDGDMDPNKFMPWINELVQKEGPNILRSKGILAFKDDPKRFVFQGVHMILDGDSQRDWKPGEKRESKVVFIGRNLKEDELRKGVLSCLA